MAETLTVTPTQIPAGQPTDLHFVGSGWQPGASLAYGVQGDTSTSGVVEPDGTFDLTFPYDPSVFGHSHGTVKAFVDATGQNYRHGETVTIHIG